MVREHVQALCDSLQDGDVERVALALQEMSRELQANLGPLGAMLPLPLTAATIESIEMAGTAYLAVIHLVGDEGSIRLQTRWKERDGKPTMVEGSHMPEAPVVAEDDSVSSGDEAP